MPGRASRGYATILGVLALGCTGDPTPEQPSTLTSKAETSDVLVDFEAHEQFIEGFGASSAWTGANLGQVLLDQLFSAETGLGLSLLRVRIAPDGTTGEAYTALQAQQRGAAVWAAPWSPPGAWKTSGTDNYGGALLPEYYDDWADRLAAFVAAQRTRGIHLVGLSAQNEPNWRADWETCEWTPAELATFIGDYLAPALQARGLTTPIIAPETINWNTVATYADALLANEASRAAVSVIATHSYDGVPFFYAPATEHQKSFWETEVGDDGSRDDGMDSALRVARRIHDHLTIARVNAWHFWWILPNGGVEDGNHALVNGGVLTRRGYVMGNFSKFVRPGARRVAAVENVERDDIHVTAFEHEASRRVVIVAINSGSSATTQRFSIAGAHVAGLTPWETSDAAALEARPEIAVEAGSFTVELPPRSVTSFVGIDGPGAGGAGGAGGSAGDSAAGAAGGAGQPGSAGATSGGASGHGGAGSGNAGSGGYPAAGGRTGGSAEPPPSGFRAAGQVNLCGCGYSAHSAVGRYGWALAAAAGLVARARRGRRRS